MPSSATLRVAGSRVKRGMTDGVNKEPSHESETLDENKGKSGERRICTNEDTFTAASYPSQLCKLVDGVSPCSGRSCSGRPCRGRSCRKLVVSPFDIIYRYNGADDLVEVIGLLYGRETK